MRDRFDVELTRISSSVCDLRDDDEPRIQLTSCFTASWGLLQRPWGCKVQMLSSRLSLFKEDTKFSCAHFIVHADERERLHGHNYRVSIVAESSPAAIDNESGLQVDFGVLKKALRAACAELDERFICPTKNPFLVVEAIPSENQLKLTWKKNRDTFIMPLSDAVLLPIPNATVEALAGEVAKRFVVQPGLEKHIGKGIERLEVCVMETAGQEARLLFDAARLLEEVRRG
jgi:6-pyruvoyl-tetrahydropterin synthase